jgi:ribosome-associated toxin RatA of RatAB toxin-antitoxin module
MGGITIRSTVHHTMTQVMQTIIEVESYPSFLPGCHGVRLMHWKKDGLDAEMTILNGIVFVTKMRWTHQMVWLENSFVRGQWSIAPCSNGTEIQLQLHVVAGGLGGCVLRAGLPHYLPIMKRAFEDRLRHNYRLHLPDH